jgi:myosin heavy subunit
MQMLLRMHSSSLESWADMVRIGDLNEAAILHNLRLRYTEDAIYTYIGPTLISTNPFKQLPIYKRDSLSNVRPNPRHPALARPAPAWLPTPFLFVRTAQPGSRQARRPSVVRSTEAVPLSLRAVQVTAYAEAAAAGTLSSQAPHLYGVAAAAFRELKEHRTPQSLVISGE